MLRSDPTPRQEQKPKPKKNNTQPKTVPGRATSRLAVDVTPTPRGLVAALLSLPYGEKKNPSLVLCVAFLLLPALPHVCQTPEQRQRLLRHCSRPPLPAHPFPARPAAPTASPLPGVKDTAVTLA